MEDQLAFVKPLVTETTMRIRAQRGYEPDRSPLFVTGNLLASIAFEPIRRSRYFREEMGEELIPFRTFFIQNRLGVGVGRVFVDPINEEVKNKAMMLHYGGHTSVFSMIPVKYIPPRPFIYYPGAYMGPTFVTLLKNKFIEIMSDLFPNRKF